MLRCAESVAGCEKTDVEVEQEGSGSNVKLDCNDLVVARVILLDLQDS